MTTTQELLANPYEISISVIIPTIDFNGFSILYKTLLDTCSNPSDVELILKIDNDKNILDYYKLCEESPFKYKILLYPQYNGRYSLHHFYNDLGSLASGKVIWILNDDAVIVSKNDWYKPLVKTRGSFKDNIYCVMIPYDNGKGTKQIIPTPAFTKEWYNFCKEVTKFPNYDRWLCEMSKGLKRQVIIDEKDILVDMPKGHRVLSKEDRKKIFYPVFNKTLSKLKAKL